MTYDPQKIADQMVNNPIKNPRPVMNNPYYPVNPNGSKSSTPVAHPPSQVWTTQNYKGPGRPANNGIQSFRGKPMGKRGK